MRYLCFNAASRCTVLIAIVSVSLLCFDLYYQNNSKANRKPAGNEAASQKSDRSQRVLWNLGIGRANEAGRLAIDTPYSPGNHNQAASGLHATLNQLIAWNNRLSAHMLISEQTRSAMWQRFPYKNSNEQHAFGWGIHDINGKKSYGFSGSGCTAYRMFPEQDLSIIFLSNGFQRSRSPDRMIEEIAALVN